MCQCHQRFVLLCLTLSLCCCCCHATQMLHHESSTTTTSEAAAVAEGEDDEAAAATYGIRRKFPSAQLGAIFKSPPPSSSSSSSYGSSFTALKELEQLHSSSSSLDLLSQWSTTASVNDVCDFESPCPWTGQQQQGGGFQVKSASDITELKKRHGNEDAVSGPQIDADGNANGHFLYLSGRREDRGVHHQVYSPWYDNWTTTQCRVNFSVHASNINASKVQILVETVHTSWVVADVPVTASNSWLVENKLVGQIRQRFRLIFEIWIGDRFPSHAAFDNIGLIKCFPGVEKPVRPDDGTCGTGKSFECDPGRCVDSERVCDFQVDCPNGRDETNKCDQLALRWRAYCNFEDDDLCGWQNSADDDMEWVRNSGTTNITGYGQRSDHTYRNSSGHYMYVKSTLKGTMGHKAVMRSVVFPPPPRDHADVTSPLYNSCKVRFYYRLFGQHKPIGSITLKLIVLNRSQAKESNESLWEIERSEDKNWHRVAVVIPNVRNRYRLEFVGIRGLRHTGHMSIDDLSLSPECLPNNGSLETYEFNTCGARGPRGPTHDQCLEAYANTSVRVTIVDADGIQQWLVPETGIYSIVASGAGGGRVARNKRISRGAVAGGVFHLDKGDVIYLLVGQQGTGQRCDTPSCLPRQGIALVKNLLKEVDSGSGGGGASFVFKMNPQGQPIPLLVAGGGGGLAYVMDVTGVSPDGRGENKTVVPVGGLDGGSDGAGGGGGWRGVVRHNSSGRSLLEGGAVGGAPCHNVSQMGAFGGFGGGGGACLSGGGGGGYAGGDTVDNGMGGVSFVASSFGYARVGRTSDGSGSINVTPAFYGCGCDYLCVILADDRNPYICLCPDNAILDEDEHRCIVISERRTRAVPPFITEHLVIILPVVAIIVVSIATVMFFMYHRYRRQLAADTTSSSRQDYINNPELQLNRLRQAGDGAGMITEYNPNYEFGGSTCTLQDLREVPRENLTLVKALGQGAFGEVYQGCLANLPIPVAIKTLPELSSSQAEMDFLTEALIMSKFNHPNIVKFIGVCFDKLPKFIILELLPGGDLKSFLRESRSKPDKSSPLTMIDLLALAIDVAKGCKYLEENHFIHRDIAARNCLLTSKDAKRVVKIADFGMARDIYRADYYRKGGKAMLPVKWMPPEAFLDGIFTSKTDVWSFGVLLWEVMSMGYMPYPGRGNQDVMQLVTSGGRLEPPSNCPQPVYHIMSQCWHPMPEERPNFATILERLGYCLQDPDVLNSPLPVFHRPPSTERDATVMRPSDSDNVCLQVQRLDNEPQSPASTDYLIPIPSSSYSLCTEKTELQSASSMESVDRLLDIDGDSQVPPIPPVPAAAAAMSQQQPSSWETSFSQPKKATPTAASSATQLRQNPMWSSGGYQSVPTQDDAAVAAAPPPPKAYGASSGSTGNFGVPFTTISPPESSPARRSPPSAIARQRPSVKKPVTGTPSSSSFFPLDNKAASETPLPLDPSTLLSKHQPTTPALPYVNVAMSSTNPNPSPPPLYSADNEPYTITAPRGATPSSSKNVTNKEATKC